MNASLNLQNGIKVLRQPSSRKGSRHRGGWRRSVMGLGGEGILFDDVRRVATLRDYRVLDTSPEEAFDNITRLTAKLFKTPIALVSLVDRDRQWFKSRTGLPETETPRAISFCDHAVRKAAPLIVPDATLDERFKSNPLVTGDPNIRFYCGVPLKAANGDCLGTLCVIDRKPRELEAEELSMLSALARQVELELEIRRRLALLDEALEAERSQQRSRDLLVAMVVHDLRSPLATLTLLASMIEPRDDVSRESLDDILLEVEHMRRMLTDVLDICLDHLGELKPRRADVPLHALVRGSVKRLEQLAQQREQQLVVEGAELSAHVYADAQLLERVLENLIGNAIHHGPPGAHIRIALRQVEPARARVEVRDRGQAISAAQREVIFRPFERKVTPGEGAPSGYGLGLAFCRIAVKAHGGQLGVEADREGGNVFYFELPTT